MASAEALHAIGLISALLRLIAERDPHPELYEAACLIADHIEDERLPELMVRLEVEILSEAGFRLDLQAAPPPATRMILSMYRRNRVGPSLQWPARLTGAGSCHYRLSCAMRNCGGEPRTRI